MYWWCMHACRWTWTRQFDLHAGVPHMYMMAASCMPLPCTQRHSCKTVHRVGTRCAAQADLVVITALHWHACISSYATCGTRDVRAAGMILYLLLRPLHGRAGPGRAARLQWTAWAPPLHRPQLTLWRMRCHAHWGLLPLVEATPRVRTQAARPAMPSASVLANTNQFEARLCRLQ